MQKPHPLFEIVTTSAGVISIRNKAVNEIMHNPVGPWAEANALYIDQPRLREKLTENLNEEFVVFDVGLGAAANALAALACYRNLKTSTRPMRLISFEKDLELLRFAIQNAAHFEHFSGYEKPLEQILEQRFWSEGGITWELREGNFLDLIDQEQHHAHLVFYDPYSPKVNNEMWTMACFKKLRAKCRGPENGGASLYTYTLATHVRASLIIAGFYVGQGLATGLKNETTQAATDLKDLSSPLAQAWYERWQRSHLRRPLDCPPEEEAACDLLIEKYMSTLMDSLKSGALTLPE